MSGREADILELDVDARFNTPSTGGIPLTPDIPLASFLGLLELSLNFALRNPSLFLDTDFTVGLDTNGFYLLDEGPDFNVLEVGGEFGVDANLMAELFGEIDLVTVTGSLILRGFGSVSVTSDDGKVRPNELLNQPGLRSGG